MLSTDITDKEIRSNIVESVKELKTEFKKIASKNRVIETVGGTAYKEFINSRKTDKITETIKEKIDFFLKECNTKTIKASEQPSEPIFKDYFLKKPPFGEGKKKHEFPDAFVLLALKNWCFENSTNIFTISTDKDFKKFCDKEDQFNYFPSLYEFINHVLMDEGNVVKVINEMIKENEKQILGKVENEIENIGAYLGDAEGEVFFDKITDFSIIESSVVALYKDKAKIFCLIDTTLNFEASYWDPDSWTSIKDEGVKEIFYHHRIEGDVEKKFTLEVEFEIKFDANKFRIIEINDVVVNSGSGLEYTHYDFEDYY